MKQRFKSGTMTGKELTFHTRSSDFQKQFKNLKGSIKKAKTSGIVRKKKRKR